MLRIYDTGAARESRSGSPTYFQQPNPHADPTDDVWEQVATRLLRRTPGPAEAFAKPVGAEAAPALLGVLRFQSRYWLFGVRSDQRDAFGRSGRLIIAIRACQSLLEITSSDPLDEILDFVGTISRDDTAPQAPHPLRELNRRILRETAEQLAEGTRATWMPAVGEVRLDAAQGSPTVDQSRTRSRDPADRGTRALHRYLPLRTARWRQIRDLATLLVLLTSVAVNGILAMQIRGRTHETVELKDGQLAKVIILKRWKPRTDSGDGDPGLGGQDKAQQPSQRGPTSTSLDDNSSKPNERQEGAVDQSTLR